MRGKKASAAQTPGGARVIFKSMVWGFVFCLLAVLIMVPVSDAAASGRQSISYNDHIYKRLSRGERILQPRTYESPQQKTVYLTFDDGPSLLTPKILDILKKENIKATFFEVGEHVESYPDIVKRVVREGHALGNHTYDHEYQDLYSDFPRFWNQVAKTERAFLRTVGEAPALLRAPGGTYRNFDAFYFYYLDQAGYTVHDWNIDSADARRKHVPASEIVSSVRNSRFSHEAVVLLHDGTGHEESVKALPAIIQLFKDKGYRFAALSEKVKPVLFTLGASTKWDRRMSMDDFLKGGALSSRGSFPYEQKAPLAAVPEQPVRNPVKAKAAYARLDKDVSVTWKTQRMEFSSEETLLVNGSLYVPLRKTVQEAGGSLRWKPADRTVTLLYGKKSHSYQLEKGDVTGPTGTLLLDGRLYVPLRGIMELMERPVFAYESGGHNVA
ncbi:polysaccharide deacetylase [Paenibacillus gansuensis]|uniref:Polysaccharide deacetylase family protein n=1 Tax=Paenibacillus gansuensis TaxID=306542 RepID=A0ABW5PJB7_9BACL